MVAEGKQDFLFALGLSRDDLTVAMRENKASATLLFAPYVLSIDGALAQWLDIMAPLSFFVLTEIEGKRFYIMRHLE